MIKKSKVLNRMCGELYNIDFYYLDDILTNHSDYYTISRKTSPEDGFFAGHQLCLKSVKKNMPIFEVECYRGDFSVYFIKPFKEIKNIFKEALLKAKQKRKAA